MWPFRAPRVPILTGFVLALASTGAVRANVLRVPEDAPTLNAAISEAAAGDTILLGSGVYSENVSVNRSLTIVGSGDGASGIDGSAQALPAISVSAGVTLTLQDVTVVNGTDAPNFGANGGGINSNGSLTLIDCRIANNTGIQGGGVYASGALTMVDCSVYANTAQQGGGVYAGGGALLQGCVFTGNSAVSGGGLVSVASLTVRDCSFVGNAAAGPSIGYQQIAGDGGGAMITSPFPNISACTFSANTAANKGGALSYEAPPGSPSDTMTITDTTIDGNVAALSGGGIYLAARLSINRSTISNNVSYFLNPGTLFSDGATLFLSDPNWPDTGASLTMDNCTVANNNGQDCGGIYAVNSAQPAQLVPITVTDSTFSQNGAPDPGGPQRLIVSGGRVTSRDSLYVYSGSAVPGGPAFNGALVSEGHNLFTGTVDANSLMSSDEAQIGPQTSVINSLADNGGPTKTCSLTANSLARHFGAPSLSKGDQRGVPRPTGTQGQPSTYPDSGAFQTATSVTVLALNGPTVTIGEGDPAAFQIVLSDKPTEYVDVQLTETNTGSGLPFPPTDVVMPPGLGRTTVTLKSRDQGAHVIVTAGAVAGATGSASATPFTVAPRISSLVYTGTQPFHVGSTATFTITLPKQVTLATAASWTVSSPVFNTATISVNPGDSTGSATVTFTGTGTGTATATAAPSTLASGSASSPSFTVYGAPVAPSAVTNYAGGVGLGIATLNATVNPGNDTAGVVFDYGPTTAYGSTTSAQTLQTGATTASFALTGLSQGTAYHYRVRATNSVSTATGADSYFAVWNPNSGDALQLNSSADYATVADSASLHPAGAWSVEAWVRPDSIGTPRYIVSKGISDTVPGQYGLRITGPGKAAFAFSDGTTSAAVGTTTLNAGNWYHIAGTWDGTTMLVYVNGVQEGSLARPGPIAVNTDVLQIGRLAPSVYNWVGAIDDVRIWNTARTQAQIQANMHKGLAGNEAGLVAYYKCDEGAGVTLNDATANANNGALSGATLWVGSRAPIMAAFTMPEATRALQIAAGLLSANSVDYYRFNIEPMGALDNRIDIRDAARIIRKASGTDYNP